MLYSVALNQDITDDASITMLEWLLDSGHFNINAGDNDEGPIYTAVSALTGAVQSRSERRARYLLYKGAVPSLRAILHARRVRDETGAPMILMLLEANRAGRNMAEAPAGIPDTHPIYFTSSFQGRVA